MRQPEIEILEEALDEDGPMLSRWDLDVPIDFLQDDFDDESSGDELGLRSLYENPDSFHWPDAA